MLTLIIILSLIGIGIIYDIYALIAGKRTITSWFREWFGIRDRSKGLVVVPYAFGILIGHFGLPIDFSSLPIGISYGIFIATSVLIIAFTMHNIFHIYEDRGLLYRFLSNKWYISLVFGAFIGSFWY